MFDFASNWEEVLRGLAPGWDGEDAPTPSEVAITEARNVLSLIQANSLPVDLVEADAMGGVDIYMLTPSEKSAWIYISNSGYMSLVLSQFGITAGYKLDDGAFNDLKAFLCEDALLPCLERLEKQQ